MERRTTGAGAPAARDPAHNELEEAGGGGNAAADAADPGDNAIARAEPPGSPEPRPTGTPWMLYNLLLHEDYIADLEAEHASTRYRRRRRLRLTPRSSDWTAAPGWVHGEPVAP